MFVREKVLNCQGISKKAQPVATMNWCREDFRSEREMCK